MEGQTVYSTFDCLDEVFLFKNESADHKLLYNIITNHSDVMIDLKEDDFNKLIIDNPFIKSLLKRPHKKTDHLKPFFDNMHEEDLSHFPRDIFLLDEDDGFCKDSIKKYGVLVMNSGNLEKIKILSKKFARSFKKTQVVQKNKGDKVLRGWAAFTSNFNITPINSVVLIDNHIFNHIGSGKSNLTNLLSSVLPKELESDFHILIIIDNRESKFSFEKLDKIREDIQSELSLKVDYKIEFCITSHSIDDEFHKRILITNYHIIESDFGFDIFNNAKVKKPTDPVFLGLYHTLSRDEGDPEIKRVWRKLKHAKEKINNIGNPKQGLDLLVGDCKNRLLADF